MGSEWPKREFLLAAIEDSEGTIRATDIKASIALVLHGILFAGILATARASGRVFCAASTVEQGILITSLAIAGCAFLVSVIQLLRVVKPAPVAILPDVPDTDRFFVRPVKRVSALSGHPEMPAAAAFAARIDQLTEADAEAELGAELLKLATIRSRKTRIAENGYSTLLVEVVSSLVLLATLAVAALT